ncbi:MAG TPA: hypothetical protein ENH49_01630 [Candidatus Marinimicrobia bacterium]|nr:hypothetical protein [Candidatus Neomarinimicrobiota bacterium]
MTAHFADMFIYTFFSFVVLVPFTSGLSPLFGRSLTGFYYMRGPDKAMYYKCRAVCKNNVQIPNIMKVHDHYFAE